uniref:GGDEF domain-containing protein n=1 Tax=Fervidobacterium pennivorans TaxID=93466 RepID=A0A7V4NG04_FERPE
MGEVKKASLCMKGLFLIILAGVVSGVLYFTLGLINQPVGPVIQWDAGLGKYIELDKPSKVTLNGTFEYNGVNNYIVFQKVLATKFDVYVNGVLTASFGDGSGNLWPRALLVRMPQMLLYPDRPNKITVVLHGLVGVGLYGKPYLATYEDAIQRVALIDFFRDKITLVGIGATALIVYLLLIAYQSASEKEKKVYRYLITASVFMILSLVQFTYRESSGSPVVYLLFEEFAITGSVFVLTFLFFSVLTISTGDVSLSKKFRYILQAIPVVLISIAVFSPSVKYIHIVSTISELYSLGLMFVILYFIFKHKLIELYFPVIFLYFTGIQTFYVLATNQTNELTIHYGRFVFLVFVGTATIRKFKELFISHERLKRENLIDHLTGVYNRKVIDLIPKGGIFVLLDLDGFKALNDKYGHIYGDDVLRRFAEIVKSHIRNQDYFIRLGGDEFCLIFKSVKETDVLKIVNRLYNDCKNVLGIGFSYGYAPFEDFDKAYEEADKKMYEQKMQKHGQDSKKSGL